MQVSHGENLMKCEHYPSVETPVFTQIWTVFLQVFNRTRSGQTWIQLKTDETKTLEYTYGGQGAPNDVGKRA